MREPEFPSPEASFADESPVVAVLEAESAADVIVEPPCIRLAGGRSAVQLRVLVRDAEGRLRDATTEADYRIESGDAATLLAPGLVAAAHSGCAEVVIEVAGRVVRTPVRVAAPPSEPREHREPRDGYDARRVAVPNAARLTETKKAPWAGRRVG